MADPITLGLSAYAAVCGVVYAVQRKLLYDPDRSRPEPDLHGVPEMSEIVIHAADGTELVAWYHPPADGAHPVIAYYHGNAGHIGNRGEKIRHFLGAGFGVLMLSYRGFGGSAGRPTEQGLYHDARAALAYLRDRGFGPERIVIYGESLGSGVAVHMAAETPPAALVLEAPFTSLTTVAFQKCPYLPVPLLIRDRYNSLSKIGQVRAPLFLMHGERDRTVTVGHGRKLFAAANGPKQSLFLPEAGHTDLYDHGVADDVIRFIRGSVGLVENEKTAI